MNGLDATGSCNADHVRLVPGSLTGPECGSGADLAFDGSGKLVGRKNNNVVCDGKKLVGAKFTVDGKNSVELTIAKVRETKKEGKKYEGYRIEYNDEPVCDDSTARSVLLALDETQVVPRFADGSDAAPVPYGYKPAKDDELAIAMPGPIFDIKDATKTNDGESFFNLACTGDALAKTRFYALGGDPTRTSAALRMITAKYVDKRSFTVRGMTIGWSEAKGAGSTLPPDPVVEAIWSTDGAARCISRPRLTTLPIDKERDLFPLDHLPRYLQPADCSAPDGQSPPGTCAAQADWTSGLRAEAKPPLPTTDCSNVTAADGELTSYVDGSGKLVLTPKNAPPK